MRLGRPERAPGSLRVLQRHAELDRTLGADELLQERLDRRERPHGRRDGLPGEQVRILLLPATPRPTPRSERLALRRRNDRAPEARPQHGSDGSASPLVDYANLPQNLSIAVGDVRRFQFWFRDPAAGGEATNLADGLKVFRALSRIARSGRPHHGDTLARVKVLFVSLQFEGTWPQVAVTRHVCRVCPAAIASPSAADRVCTAGWIPTSGRVIWPCGSPSRRDRSRASASGRRGSSRRLRSRRQCSSRTPAGSR